MNFKFSKMISVVCVLAMLLSCFSSITMYADEAVEIITAEYDVYDGELRVLAKLPEDGASGAVVTACGAEVSGGSWMEQGDYMLFTKTGYTPATLGICNVMVTCGAVSDSVNVRFIKGGTKTTPITQNFNSLASTTMSSVSDDSVTSLLTGGVLAANLPNNTTNNATADIVDAYGNKDTGDKSLVINLPKAASKTLPGLNVNPTDVTSGIVEISYDFYTNKTCIRNSLYIYAGTGNGQYNYTSTVTDAEPFTSAYYATYQTTSCMGLTDRLYKVNTWYNVRFLMNLDENTYEFYVNNELYDCGTYANANGYKGFGRVVWQIGCKYTDTETEVALDNISVLHTETNAAPSTVSYTTAGSEDAVSTSLLNAEIPYAVAENMTVGLNGAIGYTADDIALVDSVNEEVNAEITVSDNNNITVDTSSLTLGEYKVVLSENVTFNSVDYGAPTEIPFTVIPTLALVSPADGASVKKGVAATIKACTPDAESVDLYINNEYLSTLTPDANECVSYNYATESVELGTKDITFVINKANATEYLRGSFVVNEVQEADITPLDTFDSFDSADLTNSALDGITAQNKTTLRSEKTSVLDHDNAAKVYYTKTDVDGAPSSLAGKKALFIQDVFDTVSDGRIVFEHDLYVEDENCTLNYELMGQINGTGTKYTFYPLQTNTLFNDGKIGGILIDGGYANAWYKVKIVIDFITGQSEVYFDGEFIKSGELYTSTSGTTAVPAYQQIRINYSPSTDSTVGTEEFGMAVDNWRVYKELPVPVVDSITAGGNAAEENGVISSTDTFAVAFAGNYTYSALDSTNVSLLVNGVASDGTEVSYDKATNTLAVKAVNAVPAHSDVQIVIDDSALLYDAATAAGADTAINLKVCDSGGLYANRAISKIDSTMVLSAKLDAASERSVTLIFATYNGNRLVNIDTEEVLVDGAKNITLTLPVAGASDAKAFIWDSFTSLIPQIGVTGPVAAN